MLETGTTENAPGGGHRQRLVLMRILGLCQEIYETSFSLIICELHHTGDRESLAPEEVGFELAVSLFYHHHLPFFSRVKI
jgi:hypothetical protein